MWNFVHQISANPSHYIYLSIYQNEVWDQLLSVCFSNPPNLPIFFCWWLENIWIQGVFVTKKNSFFKKRAMFFFPYFLMFVMKIKDQPIFFIFFNNLDKYYRSANGGRGMGSLGWWGWDVLGSEDIIVVSHFLNFISFFYIF